MRGERVDLEPGAGQSIADSREARRASARGFADDETMTRAVGRDPGLGGGGGGVNHASQHLPHGDGGRGDPARVDALQRTVLKRRDPFTEPPRHAVHGGQHDRLRAQERPEARGEPRQCLLLEREDHQVLGAEVARIVRGERGRCAQQRVVFVQTPAVIPQRHERGTARQHRHGVRRGQRQPRAEEAADGSRADHAHLHDLPSGDWAGASRT